MTVFASTPGYGICLTGMLFLLILPATSSGDQALSALRGRASVIDGDTIEIRGQRIRLHGIDAPESAQLCHRFPRHQSHGSPWRCGQQASLALSDRIASASVTCTQTDMDRYGRMIAVCRAGGEDLNAWMVAQGWAVAYRRYASDYEGLEGQAKAAGRNIWSGRFVMPWDWRRGDRLQERAEGESTKGCDIKGNISSGGERIYHVPGGVFYEKVQVDTASGERWFCSEQEAWSAGWRRSQQ